MNSGKSKFYYEVYGLDIESEIKIDELYQLKILILIIKLI